jgi:hypothetical protein
MLTMRVRLAPTLVLSHGRANRGIVESIEPRRERCCWAGGGRLIGQAVDRSCIESISTASDRHVVGRPPIDGAPMGVVRVADVPSHLGLKLQ